MNKNIDDMTESELKNLIIELQEKNFRLVTIKDKALEYVEYLKTNCSNRLNKGHLRKMKKILRGDNDEKRN